MPSCPDGFIYRDTCPDGSPCFQCFRAYRDDVAGAEHLIDILYIKRPSVLAAASQGNLRGMAEAMSETRYYTATVNNYEKAMRRNLASITSALGEEAALSAGRGSIPIGKGIGLRSFFLGATVVGLGLVAYGALK